MSQTVAPARPAPGGNAPAPGNRRGPVGTVLGALQHSLDRTPGQLRFVAVVAVLGAILVALGGAAALRERSAALDSAAQASAHLVLLQGVQTDLVQADADATNSFLAFGLEPRSQRVDYVGAVERASRNLARAAAASPADADVLGQANSALTRYSSYVASARANNLQGLPVGASYLKTAGELLRSDVLPRIDERTTADTEAVDDAYDRAGRAALWLTLSVVLGLGALIWAQVDLARRSRRVLNVPLTAATGAVLLGLVLSVVAMAVAQSRADSVRADELNPAIRLSASRVAAFDAKSIESQTLISRGSGATNEPRWREQVEAASAGLTTLGVPMAVQALGEYQDRHRAIRDLDDEGDWQEARKLAISTTDASANAAFGGYASTTDFVLKRRADATVSGLSDAGVLLTPAALLMLVLGLVAAVGAWWGVMLRLEEYR